MLRPLYRPLLVNSSRFKTALLQICPSDGEEACCHLLSLSEWALAQSGCGRTFDRGQISLVLPRCRKCPVLLTPPGAASVQSSGEKYQVTVAMG